MYPRLFLLIALFALAPVASAADDALVLVKDGKAQCSLAVEPGAPFEVQSAADDLVHLVEQSTGATIPAAVADGAGVQIHIGRTAYVNSLSLKLDELDGDALLIAFPDAAHIVLVGGSPWGTMYAVDEFLERYVHVRWLMPGDVGVYVPKLTDLVVPRDQVRQTPAFFSRLLSSNTFGGFGPKATDHTRFIYHNRIHGRVSFHHNLLNLLPVSVFGKTNPEFYPILNGERYIPKDDADYHWQPDLEAPGIVDAAIKRIDEFFNTHRDADSYSLGMNDSHSWAVDRSKAPRNSIGNADLSDYYYRWASDVAAGVLKTHPDKWFGCLAYNETTDPPQHVDVNDHIVPFICYDRMKWVEPDLRESDQQRTIAWAKQVERVGWYDYIYGDRFYIVPRVYMHVHAEALRFAHKAGVRAVYAEAYPGEAWIEGPKLYAFLKMLWNPDLDLDALLDDWYRCAVGDKAAPSLAKYYGFWEAFWTRRVPKTDWFTHSAHRGPYLPFNNPGYLAALTMDDIKLCDALISDMMAKADSPQAKARAQFIADGWAKTRKTIRPAVFMRHLLGSGALDKVPRQQIYAADFEPAAEAGSTLPGGWSFWQRSESRGTPRWNRQGGRQSRGSLVVDTLHSSGPLCFIHHKLVRSDAWFYAECYARAIGVQGDGGIALYAKWQDAEGKWMPEKYTAVKRLEKITPGTWQKIRLYFHSPDTNSPTLVLMPTSENLTVGEVWFDDVQVSRLTQVPDELRPQPDPSAFTR